MYSLSPRIAPPSTRPWPSMCLVPEYTTTSTPSGKPCCSSGVAKTLSSTTFAPAACASSVTAAMSTSDCIGFDGVSKNTAWVGYRQRLLPLREVLAVDEDGLHAPARQDLVAHHEARPEQAARGDQPVTGAQQRAQRGEHRGHAARGGERRGRTLDQAQPLLEHGDGRVAVARVDEAVDLAGERLLRDGRRRVDVAGGQEHRLGGLFEPGPQQPAAHADGGLADAVGQLAWACGPRAGRSVLLTPASRAIRSPASRCRRGGRAASRWPSKPSSTL